MSRSAQMLCSVCGKDVTLSGSQICTVCNPVSYDENITMEEFEAQEKVIASLPTLCSVCFEMEHGSHKVSVV